MITLSENPERLPKKKVLIRFADCDPNGHLNNTRYLDYFLNAREDHLLENYGLSVFKHGMENGFSWISIKYQLSFLKEAFVQEEVIINSRLIGFTDRIIRVEMQMMDNVEKLVNALLWADFIYFDVRKRKAAVHDEWLADFFKKVMYPVKEKDFDQRVENLRRDNKNQ